MGKLSLAAIVNRELIPALGCTEPIALAYAAASARELLGQVPERIVIEASPNIIKNVKSVIVPNSGGMKGIAAAAALGALAGDVRRELQVLTVLRPEDHELCRNYLAEGRTTVQRLESDHILHIIVHLFAGGHEACVEIQDLHTNIVSRCLDGVECLHQPQNLLSPSEQEETNDFADYCLADLYQYARTTDLKEVRETLERQMTFNRAISEEGLRNPWGAQIGRYNQPSEDLKERDLLAYAKKKAVSMAAAGSDGRMSGCDLPVVINSGSGNQGMAVSLPLLAFAEVYQKSDDELLRALLFANLVALYQKSFIGRLSAFCGAISAATGAGAGIAFLLGADLDVIGRTIINCLGTVAGIVCDGAKPSCAAKIAAGVSCAVDSYDLALRGICFQDGDGLIKHDADQTIAAIGDMARVGMKGTDQEIIKIMLEC